MRLLLPLALLLFAVPAQAEEARAPLDLRVVIPRVMQLRLQDHPGRIEVTSADIARGEVVVPHAKRVCPTRCPGLPRDDPKSDGSRFERSTHEGPGGVQRHGCLRTNH